MFHLHWTTHDNTKGGILGRDNVLGQVWDLFDMYIGCKPQWGRTGGLEEIERTPGVIIVLH